MFHVDEYVLNELAGALNDRYKCGKGMKGNRRSACGVHKMIDSLNK